MMKKNYSDRRSSHRPFENDRHESRFKSNFRQKENSDRREKRSDNRYEDRPARPSRGGDRFEKPFREGRNDRFDRPARTSRGAERFEKPNRGADRFEKPKRGAERFEKPFREGRNDRFEKPFRGGDRFDRPAHDNREERFEKPFRPNRYENNFVRNDRTDRKPKTEKKVLVQEFSGLVRLNKFIANSGVCSRREADELIGAGVVTVNGEVVTELGIKVNPDTDDIRFNGERLRGEEKIYVLMNKPKGYVTTTSDPHADACVMDLISPELCPQRIFPVGRLDKSTTGVLLLTNDGGLAEKLTHPSYHRKKIYHVFLDKNLKRPDFEALLEGFELEDGFIAADALSYIDEHEDEVGMEIHSGRNRIVRRMFEHLGYTVKKLDRVYFAGMTKKNLKRGQWRFLTDTEVVMLKNGQYE